MHAYGKAGPVPGADSQDVCVCPIARAASMNTQGTVKTPAGLCPLVIRGVMLWLLETHRLLHSSQGTLMRSLPIALAFSPFLFMSPSSLAIDPQAQSAPDAVKSITGREIGGHLRFLASDLMKGRDTASPETRLAAEYLAGHLFAAGAEPMGDQGSGGRSYFQRFPLEVVTPQGGGDRALLDARAQRIEAAGAVQAGDGFRPLSARDRPRRGRRPGRVRGPWSHRSRPEGR